MVLKRQLVCLANRNQFQAAESIRKVKACRRGRPRPMTRPWQAAAAALRSMALGLQLLLGGGIATLLDCH